MARALSPRECRKGVSPRSRMHRITSNMSAGIASPEIVGMRAHRTYLGVPRNLETFARHGHELTVLANSDVVAQFMRARSEGTRPGSSGEFDHFRRVARIQF